MASARSELVGADAGPSPEMKMFQMLNEARTSRGLNPLAWNAELAKASSGHAADMARRGYMENLPAIYRRSDAVGRNLVRDLCFLMEHMFDSVDVNLVDGWRFYDPHVAPPELK